MKKPSKKNASFKTTISFPRDVIEELRFYMARNGLSHHEQSKIVIEAVRQFLTMKKDEIAKMQSHSSQPNPNSGTTSLSSSIKASEKPSLQEESSSSNEDYSIDYDDADD